MNARIIPAYAGSTAILRPVPGRRQDHPRIRGEHRIVCLNRWVATGSSPHTRGARGVGQGRQDGLGIIPAYAGSTTRAWPSGRSPRDHPRIRGEHFICRIRLPSFPGSSPHTRGAPTPWSGPASRGRIIPAYAGSTPPTGSTWTPTRDHPRIRGEHHRRGRHPRRPRGSSPHTRGARQAPVHADRVPGIIPAYAGSTPGPAPAYGA